MRFINGNELEYIYNTFMNGNISHARARYHELDSTSQLALMVYILQSESKHDIDRFMQSMMK